MAVYNTKKTSYTHMELFDHYMTPIQNICADGLSLAQVKEAERTERMCKLALLQTPLALKYVPAKFHTETMYLDILKRDPTLFPLVLTQTPENIRLALRCASNWNLIEGDKAPYLEVALESDPSLIVESPRLEDTEYIIDMAKKVPHIIKYVPVDYLPERAIMEALDRDPSLFHCLHDKDPYVEVYISLLERDYGFKLRVVPTTTEQEQQTSQTCQTRPESPWTTEYVLIDNKED